VICLLSQTYDPCFRKAPNGMLFIQSLTDNDDINLTSTCPSFGPIHLSSKTNHANNFTVKLFQLNIFIICAFLFQVHL
jgi:hypothetical protein